MSGRLSANMLLRETGLEINEERLARLRDRHAQAFNRQYALGSVHPLPRSRELLAYLTAQETPWAIATSGRMETARHDLAALGVDTT